MKRYVPGITAAVVAIIISSHTVIPITTFYFVWSSGFQDNRNNYSQTTNTQSAIPGANNVLAWFSISDNDNFVTDTEWTNTFNALDATNPTLNSLNDEPEQTINVGGQSVQLQLKP